MNVFKEKQQHIKSIVERNEKKNGRHPIKKQWKEHKPAGQRSECLGDADPAGNESGEAIKLNKRTKSKATQSSPYVSLYTAYRFPDKINAE